MATCIECGAYAKYAGWICPACYAQKNRPNKRQPEDFDDFEFAPTGLSGRERNYRYGMINGILNAV